MPAEITAPTWRTLLPEAQRGEALRTVEKLAASIGRRVRQGEDASLGRGQSGLALFFGHLANALDSPGAAAVAEQCLDRATATLSAQMMGPSLMGGFAGVAWAVQVVDGLLDPGGPDRGEAIDGVVERLLARPGLWVAPHDLIRGVTGIGVYALERWPRPLATDSLKHIVAQLRDSARHDGSGAHWWTPVELLDPALAGSYPSGWADLGLAHGQPGAIALLGAIAQLGVDAGAPGLLDEAVPWLLAQAVVTDLGPTFPAHRAPGELPAATRTAWCYGDPGVAAAVLVAARSRERPDWEEFAVQLAHRAADRPAAESGVVDASLCHGAAGLAHVFNRLWQATGDATVGEAALYWVDVTLQYCRLAERAGEDWALGTPDLREGPWTGLGVVEGAAGVGLALLAAATPAAPTWDGMLMLDHVAPPVIQASGVSEG